ncbi:MAG: asparagine synthase (glutamine-hydrolyzing) [Myxococcota bacterium]|jgi:asparagine synthase (glutamine-hydrolysing)
MCGILITHELEVGEAVFEAALDRIRHRGPDASGRWAGGTTRLGHRRLAILDLDERSNQPFTSANGRYTTVYNGEIYNFRELREQFGLTCRTTSDTEVVVELYQRLGHRMLEHLNGMFAFVIYDHQTNQVFAARDRLGIKPLYFMQRGDGVAFASEIAPLLDLFGGGGIDLLGVRQYLKARAFFHGRTLYKDISMLPPGHYWDNGTVRCWWKLADPSGDRVVDDSEVEALVRSAVSYRCISDVPVGSYLSGGLDSTIIAGLAAKPDTWTVGFAEMNEFEYGRIAAEAFGATHTEVLLDRDTFRRTAAEMVAVRGEPLSVPNEVLIYEMTRAVKTRNTVVLSGEGADELFFGYDRIFRWAEANPWDLREFDSRYSYGSHIDDEILEEILGPVSHISGCLNRVAHFFQLHHLHGLLRRVDNSTMRCSVEARVPFVDHRLVEYMNGVSFDYRMSGGVVKAPLKRIFGPMLPEIVVTRKKVGFPVPLESIFEDRSGQQTGMDAWLEFNMSLLLGDQWPAIREELAPLTGTRSHQ